MMIAPAHATGPSVLDLVAQTTQLWSQMLLAPLAWLTPPADLALAEPSVPALTTTTSSQLTDLVARAEPVTDHALLVLLGHFARHLGLLDLLHAVPLKQKTFTHAPHTKLIEFLLAVLAGLGHLQELNNAATPLASDTALAQAWGQRAFAHYSGVSRTLSAADADTLQAVLAALSRVSQPFIDRELQALLQSGRPVMLDIDLTGRPVTAAHAADADGGLAVLAPVRDPLQQGRLHAALSRGVRRGLRRALGLTQEEGQEVRLTDPGAYWLHVLQDLFSTDYVSTLWGTSKAQPWPREVILR